MSCGCLPDTPPKVPLHLPSSTSSPPASLSRHPAAQPQSLRLPLPGPVASLLSPGETSLSDQPPPSARRAPASPSHLLFTCPAPLHPAHSQVHPREADCPHLPPAPSVAPHCPKTGRGPRPPWQSCLAGWPTAPGSRLSSPLSPPLWGSPAPVPSASLPEAPSALFLKPRSAVPSLGAALLTERSLPPQTAAPSLRASGGYSGALAAPAVGVLEGRVPRAPSLRDQ